MNISFNIKFEVRSYFLQFLLFSYNYSAISHNIYQKSFIKIFIILNNLKIYGFFFFKFNIKIYIILIIFSFVLNII